MTAINKSGMYTLIFGSKLKNLSEVGKIFCMMILIVGRLEIFALLIAVAGIRIKRRKSNW